MAVVPFIDLRKVSIRTPRRPKNIDVRPREYLTPDEVEALAQAAKSRGRHGSRDALAIRVAARHGLRVTELCNLTWSQIDFATNRVSVRRLKGGVDGQHRIEEREHRQLKQLLRSQDQGQRFVFMTERGGRMTPSGFAKMLDRAAEDAGLPFKVHPHMLRHSCGYHYANKGKSAFELADWMGHKNIQNTQMYVKMNPDRFKDW